MSQSLTEQSKILNLEKIKSLMDKSSIASFTELAERASIHRNTIYPILRGERSPFTDSFLSLCQALGAEPTELLNTSETTYEQTLISSLRNTYAAFREAHPTLAFFLFGSRASGSAKKFSDFDVGVTGGKNVLSANGFLTLQEFLLQELEDFPCKVDILHFDSAPSVFLKGFYGNIIHLVGDSESTAYIEGKINGIKENK